MTLRIAAGRLHSGTQVTLGIDVTDEMRALYPDGRIGRRLLSELLEDVIECCPVGNLSDTIAEWIDTHCEVKLKALMEEAKP